MIHHGGVGSGCDGGPFDVEVRVAAVLKVDSARRMVQEQHLMGIGGDLCPGPQLMVLDFDLLAIDDTEFSQRGEEPARVRPAWGSRGGALRETATATPGCGWVRGSAAHPRSLQNPARRRERSPMVMRVTSRLHPRSEHS